LTQILWKIVALAMLPALPVMALDLTLPVGATATPATTVENSDHPLTVGAFQNGSVERKLMTGQLVRQVWQAPRISQTVAQLADPIRKQLMAAGWKISLDCQSKTCGGFDFRFALEVVSEPSMHVDISEYHFLSASSADSALAIEVLISQSANTAYFQISKITTKELETIPTQIIAPVTATQIITRETAVSTGLSAALQAEGHAVLEDLVFKTGSAELGSRDFATLVELAAFLKGQPDLKAAIVGHTDASGSLGANIALSQKRAGSVVDRLISEYGVTGSQIKADGVGYLSPRASNLTEEGRAKNRRVEVIITSTE
jgi:outer membrane protein OmpA-like peptidoglycan-associated protein